MARNFIGQLFLAMVFFMAIIPASGFAEKFESPENGFSINPSADWKEIPQSFQGGIVSYAKEDSTALFHTTVRDMEEPKTVSDLKWEDLFSPQFESISIKTDGETVIAGEKAKYCIYVIKPGPFKTQMEGKIPTKYMNYVIPRDRQLFSITFVDTLDGFSLDYSSFLAAVRTINFGEMRRILRQSESLDAGLTAKENLSNPEAQVA